MNNFSFEVLIVLLLLVGSIWAVTHNFYAAWFKPSVFLEDAVRGVKDWWPFAKYFRSLYGSSKWLWSTRISTTIVLLAIVVVVYHVLFDLLRLPK